MSCSHPTRPRLPRFPTGAGRSVLAACVFLSSSPLLLLTFSVSFGAPSESPQENALRFWPLTPKGDPLADLPELHLLAARGETAKITLILTTTPDRDLNERDTEGRTPLMLASEFKRESTVKYLLRKGADPGLADNKNRNAILRAARAGDYDSYEALIKGKALIGINHLTDDNGRNLLMDAAEGGDLRIFEHARLRGLLTSSADKRGVTPLMSAARGGSKTIFESLITRGFDASETDLDGFTLTHHAAYGGSPEILRAVLAAGGKPNATTPTGITPLHEAVKAGSYRTVEILLENGVNSDSPDQTLRTPLHEAARQANPGLTQRLLKAGANPSRADAAGRTALHFAAIGTGEPVSPAYLGSSRKGPPPEAAVIRMLIEAGATCDSPDRSLRTPLHHAVRLSRVEAARALLGSGASVLAKDRHQQSPYDYAEALPQGRLLALLKEKLATVPPVPTGP